MNKSDIVEFLEKFNVENKVIDNFFKNKILIENNDNLFLSDKEFKKNQVSGGELLFIQLKKKLPSKYLLNFIKHNSKNIIELHSEKIALNFTYGKFPNLENKSKFQNGKYYLVTYKNNVLGYCKFKDNKIFNKMNIGEYLREN